LITGTDSYQYFIAESLRHARSLPFSDCIRFLGGMLSALPPESEPQIREVHRALTQCDQQLDLIQIGQLKFELRIHTQRAAEQSSVAAL